MEPLNFPLNLSHFVLQVVVPEMKKYKIDCELEMMFNCFTVSIPVNVKGMSFGHSIEVVEIHSISSIRIDVFLGVKIERGSGA